MLQEEERLKTRTLVSQDVLEKFHFAIIHEGVWMIAKFRELVISIDCSSSTGALYISYGRKAKIKNVLRHDVLSTFELERLVMEECINELNVKQKLKLIMSSFNFEGKA